MPVNEILAPYYLKVKYNTGVARHMMHMYFETGAMLGDPAIATPGDYQIKGVAALAFTNLSEVVYQVFHRQRTGMPAALALEEIQVWRSAPGSNEFVASNALPTASVAGIASPIASAYSMEVFQSADRSKYRMTFFEWVDSKPQRYAPTNPPLIDDGYLGWYILKSDIPFATNDGKRLTVPVSANVGYNRRLARRYGRQIVP